MSFSFKSIFFIFVTYFLVTGCSKDTGSSSPTPSTTTTGTTAEISDVTSSTATGGGTIKSGGPEVLEKGVCWGTSTKPLNTVNFTSDGPGSGTFTSSITGLTASTKYYVRMYMTTEDGTSYGNEKNFITKPGGSGKDPVLTTALITGETSTTAETGGVISSKGASDITMRGVCWSTSSGPTTSDDKTEDGLGVGTFTSSITGLTASTKYYVRAYATNDEGTGYGSERSFTTLAGGSSQTPVLTTTTQTSVTSTTANSGGVISSDGGSSVTSRGVCWSTSASPTISGNKTSDGTGAGTFSSSITGLTANTKYYIRAYATNANGTGYGSERSFTTSGNSASMDLNGNWLTQGGLGITISGSVGAITKFNSGYQGAADRGLISLGNLNLRNITQENSLNWSCQAIYFKTTNGVPVSVFWSIDGNIKMSLDGQSITVTYTSSSNDPFTGIYFRQP